jgi:hypothetical protein
MVTPSVRLSAVMDTGPALRAAVHRMALLSGNILFVDDHDTFSHAAAKAVRAAGHQAPSHPRASPRFDGTPGRVDAPHHAEPGRVYHGFEF